MKTNVARPLIYFAGVVILCAGVAVGLVALAVGGWSALDFSSLTEIKSVRSASEGVGLMTTYNPIAIVMPAVLALTGVAGIVFAFLHPGGVPGLTMSADAVATGGSQLSAELTRVLAILRAHLGSSEAHAKGLANAQSRLTALEDRKQVRVIVSLLLDENERMRIKTNELTSQLEDSQLQIERLRTSLYQAEEKGLKDALTSIGNRRYFEQVLEQKVVEAEDDKTPLSLIMCDIDDFKRINDTLGHSVGDEVLKMFASLVENSVRESDTVARFGGEEFAMILPGMELARAKDLAERVRAGCDSRKFVIRSTGQMIGKITASFGVAQLLEGEGPKMLVRRADTHLYEAKAGGRNKVVAAD